MEHFSGWSGVNCETCKRGTTKAQLLYRIKIFFLLILIQNNRHAAVNMIYKDICFACQDSEIIVPMKKLSQFALVLNSLIQAR